MLIDLFQKNNDKNLFPFNFKEATYRHQKVVMNFYLKSSIISSSFSYF